MMPADSDASPVLSVILSYYRHPENLRLILKALSRQSVTGFEVILSEDDNNPATRAFVRDHASDYPFTLVHLHQQVDDGFRKCAMLNRSVLAARSEKLAFIDGDCVPHHHFVKAYVRTLRPGYYYSGRAVLLEEKLTRQLVTSQDLRYLHPRFVFTSGAARLKAGIYSPWFPLGLKPRPVVGRNWGICRAHLLEVNGYDEDYVRAGTGEDLDIEWRLAAHGLARKSVKNQAIVYHLHHPRHYSVADEEHNFAILARKKTAGHLRCRNGIEKLPG